MIQHGMTESEKILLRLKALCSALAKARDRESDYKVSYISLLAFGNGALAGRLSSGGEILPRTWRKREGKLLELEQEAGLISNRKIISNGKEN